MNIFNKIKDTISRFANPNKANSIYRFIQRNENTTLGEIRKSYHISLPELENILSDLIKSGFIYKNESGSECAYSVNEIFKESDKGVDDFKLPQQQELNLRTDTSNEITNTGSNRDNNSKTTEVETDIEKLEQNKNIKFLHQLNKVIDTWKNSSEGENHEHRELIVLVPNIFSLLCKLTDNDGVSEKSKSKLSKAIEYFIRELDLMPEAIIGPIGYLDDLVISALAIKYVMDYDSKDTVINSWDKSEDIFALITKIVTNAKDFVGLEIHRQLVCKIE
jgi:uncharacterized membrane protein YkvA (DUF1232 family)